VIVRSVQRWNITGFRCEVETALEMRRNIVPLMMYGFDFSSPMIADQLTGQMATLKQYNALRIPAEYFQEAMRRLRHDYLSVPLELDIHPLSPGAHAVGMQLQYAAKTASVVRSRELAAQECFERGYDATDLDEKVRFCTKASG
jgi:hypothetical protein